MFGFFEKKGCALCGKEARLGNNTLPDKNVVCDDCIKGKSSYLGSIKKYNLEQVKEHLAEREANKQKLANFRETRVIGSNYKVRIDEAQGLWLVSRSSSYKNENPDIFTFQQVTGCNVKVDEEKTELKERNDEGKYISYDPPRYEYRYDFEVTIYVNSPWFSEINFKTNDSAIDDKWSTEYREAEREAEEIKRVLTEVHSEVRQGIKEAAKPKTSVACPHCQATTLPDANNRCEYCGGAIS
jgi:hypothetical protein